jgi:hypothetical protein
LASPNLAPSLRGTLEKFLESLQRP